MDENNPIDPDGRKVTSQLDQKYYINNLWRRTSFRMSNILSVQLYTR